MRHFYSLVTLAIATAAVTGCSDGVNGDVTATQNGASTVNGSVHVPAVLRPFMGGRDVIGPRL